MNINQIRLFIQVTELGSFQKVAEQNYISQRAVSQQMHKLEDELDTQLFIRGHNSISLTTAGKFFKERCITIAELMEDTSSKLRKINTNTKTLLTIGYFSPFDALLIRPYLLKLPSNTHFSISEEGPEHILSDLLLNKLDCGILMDNYGYKMDFNKMNLKEITIHSDQMLIGISERLLTNPNHELALEDLKNIPVIYYSNEESSYLKDSFLASLGHNLKFTHIERTTSYEQMQLLVSLGEAISFYPQGLIKLLNNPNEHIQYILPKDYRGRKFQFKLIFKKNNTNLSLKKLIKLISK